MSVVVWLYGYTCLLITCMLSHESKAIYRGYFPLDSKRGEEWNVLDYIILLYLF